MRALQKRIGSLRRHARAYGRVHADAFPWRRRVTSYRTLVGEMLLQKTPAGRVAAVYPEFVRRWPTLGALRRARSRDVEAALRPLGLQRRRAEVLLTLARSVSRLHCDEASLRRYAGVGPYTAAIASTVLTHQPAGFADGGIARLVCRYFGVKPERRRAAEDPHVIALVGQVLGSREPRIVAWGVVDLARTICTPVPRCGTCPIRRSCAQGAIGR